MISLCTRCVVSVLFIKLLSIKLEWIETVNPAAQISVFSLLAVSRLAVCF